mgnify:CR=1 FL=1
MGQDVNYDEIAKQIAAAVEETDNKGGVLKLRVKQSDYMAMMNDQGVTEAAIRQVADAQAAINNATILAAEQRLLEDASLDRVVVKHRTPFGVNEVRYTRRLDTRVPGTGEKMTKYGNVSIVLRQKSRFNQELLDRCSKAVEEASNS